jgi:long-chain acyl-CoA synthetase
MVCLTPTLTKTYKAPINSNAVILGRTLPSLLDEACDRTPHAHAFNQFTETGWQSLSNQAFRQAAEEIALGLLNLPLETGDRVALLMHSDVNFCLADMGCLLAGLTNVPIDLTQTLEHIFFILNHSQAKALIVSNLDLLDQLVPYLSHTSDLKTVIVADVPTDWQQVRSQRLEHHAGIKEIRRERDAETRRHGDREIEEQGDIETGVETDSQDIPPEACLLLPQLLCHPHLEHPCPEFPHCIQVFSLAELRSRGQADWTEFQRRQLRSALNSQALATIIYIPGAMGYPQGVMLTHENLSANALTTFAEIPRLKFGAQERVLSFLPLTHVFARTLIYGHLNYGHRIYFTTTNRVIKHLKEIRPTIFATVPLLLEKMYSKILEEGNKRVKRATVKEVKLPRLHLAVAAYLQWRRDADTQRIVNWALRLAQRYELGQPIRGRYALLLNLADRLVFSHWRSIFGGHLKYLISGGAALKAEVANLLAAAGITVLQGYGLTETSAAIACNRGKFNRAGTVGVPLPGVEIAIAEDGEILVRGSYVMQGYYQNPEATQNALDAEGWLHTGDLGEFTAEGFLKITGLKKSLFKLSTGKYVTPQPLESKLEADPLVERAIAVGAERKFCAMLIFPNLQALQQQAQTMGLDLPTNELLQHPCILALYQALVDAANCHLPYWSTVKHFQLINATLSVENGLLTPTGELRRARAVAAFASEIEALYRERERRRGGDTESIATSISTSQCPSVPVATCPAFAQSLNT